MVVATHWSSRLVGRDRLRVALLCCALARLAGPTDQPRRRGVDRGISADLPELVEMVTDMPRAAARRLRMSAIALCVMRSRGSRRSAPVIWVPNAGTAVGTWSQDQDSARDPGAALDTRPSSRPRATAPAPRVPLPRRARHRHASRAWRTSLHWISPLAARRARPRRGPSRSTQPGLRPVTVRSIARPRTDADPHRHGRQPWPRLHGGAAIAASLRGSGQPSNTRASRVVVTSAATSDPGALTSSTPTRCHQPQAGCD